MLGREDLGRGWWRVGVVERGDGRRVGRKVLEEVGMGDSEGGGREEGVKGVGSILSEKLPLGYISAEEGPGVAGDGVEREKRG